MNRFGEVRPGGETQPLSAWPSIYRPGENRGTRQKREAKTQVNCEMTDERVGRAKERERRNKLAVSGPEERPRQPSRLAQIRPRARLRSPALCNCTASHTACPTSRIIYFRPRSRMQLRINPRRLEHPTKEAQVANQLLRLCKISKHFAAATARSLRIRLTSPPPERTACSPRGLAGMWFSIFHAGHTMLPG
jgi:hypothetical protein